MSFFLLHLLLLLGFLAAHFLLRFRQRPRALIRREAAAVTAAASPFLAAPSSFWLWCILRWPAPVAQAFPLSSPHSSSYSSFKVNRAPLGFRSRLPLQAHPLLVAAAAAGIVVCCWYLVSSYLSHDAFSPHASVRL